MRGSAKYSRIGPSQYHAHSAAPTASGAKNVQRRRCPATYPSMIPATVAPTATTASKRRNISTTNSVPATGAKNGSSSTWLRAVASSAANSRRATIPSAWR